ncbi:hypothetical protein FPV67DRAFT_1202978 [Lyophyllum atratum]|nr:hypothetical protein FPV67DRAFT_1202978 [Lyophyllum atratum]
MEIHIEPPSNDYATVVENIPYVFGALLVESLLFGIHCILYCICAYILGTRRNPGQLIILVAITVIFGVATADIALSYRFILHDVPAVLKLQMTVDSAVNRILPKGLLYVTNNLITDGLIIFRCYKVWGSRKYIMLVAGALLVADTVWGYLSVGVGVVSVSVTFTPVFFWSVLAFNIVMTLATAGRIWWVARAARHVLGKHQILRYHTAIAIIIESGAIYSAAILLLIVIPYGKPYRVPFSATEYMCMICLRSSCLQVIFLAISTRVVVSTTHIRPRLPLTNKSMFNASYRL